MRKKFVNYILIFLIGGAGGWIIPHYLLPLVGIAPKGPITITRREEIYINEGVNTADVANRIKNALVTVYVHEGTVGLSKFKPMGTVPGLVASTDGIIVTILESVGPGQSLAVLLSDGKVYSAQIAATDNYTGLTLLKINKTNLPVINQIPSRHVGAGEKLVAMQKRENPDEVTVYPLTAAARGIASAGFSETFDFSHPAAVLQVVPGNLQPGAVVLNKDADLVGLVTRFGKNITVLRTEDLQNVLNNFLDDQKIIWPNLKLTYQNLTAAAAATLGLPERFGILVKTGAAPLAEGDFVVELDGKALTLEENFQDRAIVKKPGEKVKVKLIRQGKETELDLTL